MRTLTRCCVALAIAHQAVTETALAAALATVAAQRAKCSDAADKRREAADEAAAARGAALLMADAESEAGRALNLLHGMLARG